MNTFKTSHIGKRAINQDYVELFYNETNQLLAVLCDGMGGHKAGDIASEMAVLQLGNQWEKTAFYTVKETTKWLNKHINIENQRIYKVSQSYSDLDGMGTTMVTAAFIKDQIIIGNIGDSRAYQLTSDDFELVTVDHSFANELRLSGEITDEEAKTHHKKNTLTRSLGVSDEVEIDFFILNESDTRTIMLCSDGLTNGIDDSFIQAVLNTDNFIEDKALKLMDASLTNGSTDNISICLIEPGDKEMNQKGKGDK